ncbi:MAG: hypothetical protein ACLR01_00130 [Vescimonas sp.]
MRGWDVFSENERAGAEHGNDQQLLGLDRRARGELGSFREMENLTSDGYPTLTVRPRRGLAGQVESPGGIAAKDALIWVDGHTLYIGGVATELVLTEEVSSSLAWATGSSCGRTRSTSTPATSASTAVWRTGCRHRDR